MTHDQLLDQFLSPSALINVTVRAGLAEINATVPHFDPLEHIKHSCLTIIRYKEVAFGRGAVDQEADPGSYKLSGPCVLVHLLPVVQERFMQC